MPSGRFTSHTYFLEMSIIDVCACDPLSIPISLVDSDESAIRSRRLIENCAVWSYEN